MDIYRNQQILVASQHFGNYNLQTLNLHDFPLVDDLYAEIRDFGSTLGGHLFFLSKRLGELTSFPWWDNLTPQNLSLDPPLGSFLEPFNDCEQGWQILIFEHDEFVYIMQGNDPGVEEFHTYFKITKGDYLSAWERLRTA